ncbi:hemopexin repeat-containing protein [Xanthovirga aplysinae]|uniref:hemopexin repeat-containing protein n=1 Tax=Xanthovirga aplysinae TaxID=2529853 RepID=UPI0012BBDA9A|nr:hemopexin repeat-containing protein [Xanthovirga aplysinae]MTI33032.1 hypothetical protein [Xanthovirga aplysinae]
MSTNNNLPDYGALFGAIDFKEGDEARSVYSPAAYLADLLQLMDDEFSSTDEVDQRRSDIRKILLDSENTFSLIPYLEIVNEVLENRIEGDVYGDKLLNASYPFSSPFNLSHEETLLYLKYLGISPEHLHKLFATEQDDFTIAREYLGLSEEEFSFITTQGATEARIEESFGYTESNFSEDMANVTTFLETSDLSAKELRELLYEQLRETEYGEQARFFINKDVEEEDTYATLDEEEENIVWSGGSSEVPHAWFENVSCFTRLAKKMGIGFTDLDLILRDCCGCQLNEESIKIIALVHKLHKSLDVPVDVIVSLFSSMNEVGHTEGDEPQDLFNRVFNNGCANLDDRYIAGSWLLAEQYVEEGYIEIPYSNDLFADENYDFRKRVQHVLGISKTDLEKIIQRLDDKEIEESLWMDAGNKMSLLNFLYRFTKLATALDISHEELFTLFDLLEQDTSIGIFNQRNTFIHNQPSTQDCYAIFLGNDVNDLQWLIQSLQAITSWMMAYDFTADSLWRIATGKFKTEKAEKAAKDLKVNLLDTLYQSFKSLALRWDSFIEGPFDQRAAAVIYRTIRLINKLKPGKPDSRLVNFEEEEKVEIAKKAVNQLSWITKKDFKGLGIEEKLTDKIFNNLVLRGYVDEQGVILPEGLPEAKENFQIETDFIAYRDDVYDLIHDLHTEAEVLAEEEDEIAFSLYPSDFEKMGIKESEINEIYDNLIFNNYIDEEGNVLHVDFFADIDNYEEFDVNANINDYSEKIHQLFKKHLKKFEEGRLVISKSIFDELLLQDVERNDLIENLIFNGYINEEFEVLDKKRILKENAESLQLALQFYPNRHAILEALQGAVEEHRNAFMTIDKTVLTKIANHIVAQWAYEDLQGDYLNGAELVPESRDFFLNADNKKDFVLSYYFDGQPSTVIFDRVAAIIKSAEAYRLTSQPLQDLKFTEEEIEELMEVLIEMEAITENHKIPLDGLEYYLDSNNALTFSVEGFEDYNKEIFFLLQAVAKNVDEAQKTIQQVLNRMALEQDDFLFSQLQGIFGLDAAIMKSISKEVFKEEKDLKSAWLKPIFESANVLDALSEEPKDRAFNIAFNRIRQFALLSSKLQLTKEEVELAFQDQNLVAKFPEKLEIPEEIDTIDALLEGEDFLYLFQGEKYWIYRNTDYELVDKIDVALDEDLLDLQRDDDELRDILEEDPIRLLFQKEQISSVDATFKDKDGNTYLITGDHYFLLPKGSDTWTKRENEFGNVDNNFETLTEVDAAYKDQEGRLFLFSNGEYVRYSNGFEFIDEGYPKSIAEDWKSENLGIELPKGYHCEPDAAFEGTDGNTYFFRNKEFISSEKLGEAMDIAAHWGKREHSFKDVEKVDAAFNDGAAIYFFSGDKVVKYIDCLENDGIQVAEGFPMKITDLYPALPHEFANGIDTAFRGEDGKIHLFKDDQSVSFIEEDFEIALQDIHGNWGVVRNNILETGNIDAALVGLDGKTYVFSGDQYFRYSGRDYSKVDPGYPRLISENWEGLAQVEAAFVLDGKTYLFGKDGDGQAIYVRYSTSDYSEMDEEDDDEKTYITPVESLPDVEEVETFPRPQDDEWWSLPDSLIEAGFEQVDAVLNGLNGKTYLFSGNLVVEFDQAHRWWSEPMTLAEKWDKLTFTSIDAALAGKDGMTYLFSGDDYVRISDMDLCKVDNSYPRTINKYWGDVENNIENRHKVDAAVVLESREDEEDEEGNDIEEINRHTYLFSGDQFFRYVGEDYSQVEAGYPKKISSLKEEPRFEELKVELSKGIDAAIADNRNVYLFEEDRCHVVSDEEHFEYATDNFKGITAAILEKGTVYALMDGVWKRVSSLEGENVVAVNEIPNFLNDAPDEYKTDLNTVLRGTDGNTYLFKGSECYNSLLKMDYESGEEWGRARNNIYTNETIDAAFVGRDGKTYVFSGDQYIEYDTDTYAERTTEDPPKLIAEKWGGLRSVMLAYVKDDKTFLFEKPDDYGRFRYVMYSNDTYEKPDHVYPKVTDLSFFGIPVNQMNEGFGHFDTILRDGDNMIFIKDQEFIRYNIPEGSWSYPKPLDLIYKGIPFNKTTFQDIKTAFVGKDGTIYFFNENCYVTYKNEVFSDIKEIKDDWGLVNNNFANEVDAAFVHDNKITYLFSGNKYVRYSSSDYRHVDVGYPKEIAKDLREEDAFKHMPKEFQYAIDELEASGTDIRIAGVVSNPRTTYVFMNDMLYVGSKSQFDTFKLMDLGRVRNNFQDKGMVDAAFVNSQGQTYLFSGDQYIRYSDNRYEYIDAGYPKLIVDDLAGELGLSTVPADYQYGIEAAFVDASDVVYLFRDEKFISSANGTEQSVTDSWGKIKNRFTQNVEDKTIDAAYTDEMGRLYVFKGDQFIRYSDTKELFSDEDDLQKYVDATYPMLISDHEATLPASFTDNLEATFTFEGRQFFVKGTEYVMALEDFHSCDLSIYPQDFKYRWGEWSDYLISDIYTLSRFKKLQDTYSTQDYTLINLLHGALGYTKEPYLAVSEIFGFDKEEVRWVKGKDAFLSSVNQFEKEFDMEGIIRIYDILSEAQRINVDASKLHEDVWEKLYGESIDRASAAESIYQMLGTIDCNDNYETLFKEVEGELHTIKRDALVPYVIANDNEVNDARDLYEKLLIDVQMEKDAETSRIKEATAAIQLFFHRYFLNLEDVDLKASNDEEVREVMKEQWKWMRNYRVWEANRKVFLYPENYIRPELRDTKTPTFETMEQDLLQGEITEDAVERIYKKYLDEYTEVSRLKIAGGYVYDEPGSSGTDKNLVLFGRTKTDPLRYYYRFGNFVNGDSSGATWEAWEPVDISIESEKVYPVYAFNRVFVFWAATESFVEDVESAEVNVTGEEGDQMASTEGNTKYRVKIYYSFYNLNEEWIQPQTLSTVIETSAPIFDVTLFVENSDKLDDYDHDNIIVNCTLDYKYLPDDIVPDFNFAYRLTPELYSVPTEVPNYENKGLTMFNLLFDESTAPSEDDIVMLNTIENNLDGPWFSYEHKGGGFLVKPDVPALSSDAWPQKLVGNTENLPEGETIDAAVYDGVTTYYFTGNQYFTSEDPTKKSISSRWGKVKNNIQETGEVDAAYADGFTTYLFSGDQFYVYTGTQYGDLDPCYPQNLAGNSMGFPEWQQIDVAFKGIDGNTYFFNNASGKYIEKGGNTEKNILGKWGVARNNFNDPNESVQVVASFVNNGKTYLFNDSQYIRYSNGDNYDYVDDGYPKEGYIANLLEEFGFSPFDWAQYNGLRVDSAYVANDILYIHYHSGIGLECDLINKTINTNGNQPETAFAFDDTVVLWQDIGHVELDVWTNDQHKGIFYFTKNGGNVTIDSAFTWNNSDIYLFSGQEYMILDKSAIDVNNPTNIEWVATGLIADKWGKEENSFTINESIDSAFTHNNVTYIFSGDEYAIYSEGHYDYIDEGYPKKISSENDFPNWNQIDAAFIGTDGFLYFFNNENQVYVNSLALSSNTTIKEKWGVIPNTLAETGVVDAAFMRENELFLLSGSQFVKYTLNEGEVDEYIDACYPKEMNQDVTQVDAAFILGDKTYLLSGDQYFKLSAGVELDALSDPAFIKGNWGNFPVDLRNGMDAALVRGNQLYFILGNEFIAFTTDDPDQPVPYEISEVPYEIIRLTSSTADQLNQALFANGVEGLLKASTQQIDEVPSFSTAASTPTNIKVTDRISNPPVNTHLDFNSANGIYYWEVFFHAPFHIAMSLNGDQKFEEAKEWYEYIYDPTQVTDYWKFLPFLAVDIEAILDSLEGNLTYFKVDETKTVREEFTDFAAFADQLVNFVEVFQGSASLDTIQNETGLILSDIESWMDDENSTYTFINFQAEVNALVTIDDNDSDRQTLLETAKTNLEEVIEIIKRLYYRYDLISTTTPAQLDTYLTDPFDPHAIAALRKIAYRKCIVMNYIDNLLDWGDMLYRQYTRESINEARMLYILAYDLLGRKPESMGTKVLSDEVSFEELAHYHQEQDPSYDFLFDLENEDPINDPYDSLSFAGTIHDSIANPYFFIPENSLFIDYWNRVEDRLFKIRNSLNIMGEKQPLPLFQPPIDPMALVNAVAGGGSLSSALADFHTPIPHYRFSFMLNKAREFAQKVEEFGGELLATIEKKDAEELNILYNKQETALLNMTTQVKENQVKDAEENIKNIQSSIDTAQEQYDHYDGLIKDGLISEEETQIGMMTAAAAVHGAAVLAKLISGLSYVVPQITAGPFSFGVTAGGKQVGDMLSKFGESTESLAEGLSMGGEVAGIYAQHRRQVQDWKIQRTMAAGEIEGLEIQMVSAQLQKAMVQRELQIHEKDIEQNEVVYRFMKEKFSNQQLYQWMSGKLSSMFYQSYKMAHDMAKQAEKAFQFETGTKESEINFIGGMYWDSQKKGLMAGESLGVDLNKMEKAYIEQDSRSLEITKNISMLELDPLAFIQLKTKGVCEFRLTEELFDYDFPGHYNRQVKTISLAFDIGEDQTINATLTQLNNKVVMEPDTKAVKYLLNPKGQQPMSIRSDWKANQQVALSYVDQYTENNGMFELRYYDDRYLPFEGTGAVSLWRLELNGKKGSYNPNDLLDVTIKLRYSADQGGDAFASAVRGALKPYTATSFFDLAYSFPQEWNTFMQIDSRDMELTFTRDMFPNMSSSKVSGIYVRYEYTGDQAATFVMNDELKLTNNKYVEISNLSIPKEGGKWKLTVQGDKANIKNVEMVVVYKAKV